MPTARAAFRYRPLLWAAVILMLMLAAFLAAYAAGLAGSRYRRFVSKPLADGSRYAFLYPAHLPDVRENVKGTSPVVTAGVSIGTMNRSLSDWRGVVRRWGITVPSQEERIGVVAAPVGFGTVQDSRRSEYWSRYGAIRHNLYIADARTRTQFVLIYECPSRDAAQFRAHDPVITGSFRVLPPRAALSSR